MGGGSKTNSAQTQQSASTNTVDPAQLAMYQNNYNGATDRANSLTPFTGQLTAGFTPAQTQAHGILSTVANDPQYAATNANATGAINGVINNPVNGSINAPTVKSGLLATTDLSPYMNPYTKDVIGSTMATLGEQNAEQNMNDNQSATAAGAFGGSRSGVANGVTNNLFANTAASTVAGLNQSNFNQAQGAATTDINNTNNADQFNANNNITAQQDTVANKLNANNQTVNAAGQLVDANNAALGTATAQGGLLGSVGDAQQAQDQTALSNAYAAYQAGQQLTLEQQNILNAALGMIPVQQTVNSTGSGTGNSTTTSTPGIGGILSGLGSLGSGLGAMGVAI